MYGDIDAAVKDRDLNEIALLLEKWDGVFDKDTFVERTKSYTVESEVALVMEWLQERYPFTKNLLPQKLDRRVKGCFVNRFSRHAVEWGACKILTKESQEVAVEIIKQLQEDAVLVKCENQHGGIDWPLGQDNWIQMSCNQSVTDNRFGTYLVLDRRKTQDDFLLRFQLCWDDEYLWFYGIYQYSKANISSAYDENRDYMRLHFDTGRRDRGEPFVRALNLKPFYCENENMDIFVEEEFYCVDGGINPLEKGTCVTHMEKSGEQYFMKVGIPWKVLHYQPEPGYEIFFDVWVGTDYFMAEWQSAYHAWYDITEYAKLVLC